MLNTLYMFNNILTCSYLLHTQGCKTTPYRSDICTETSLQVLQVFYSSSVCTSATTPCVSDTHVDTYLLRHPLGREGVYARWACLPSSFHKKSKLYCGPNGPTASIFYGIWIKQSVGMVFIFNLDKLLLKKLFPTMNI